MFCEQMSTFRETMVSAPAQKGGLSFPSDFCTMYEWGGNSYCQRFLLALVIAEAHFRRSRRVQLRSRASFLMTGASTGPLYYSGAA